MGSPDTLNGNQIQHEIVRNFVGVLLKLWPG